MLRLMALKGLALVIQITAALRNIKMFKENMHI